MNPARIAGFFAACAMLSGCPFLTDGQPPAGSFRGERTWQEGSFTFRAQLYEHNHIAGQDLAVHWCRTAATARLQSARQARLDHLRMSADGWAILSSAEVPHGDRGRLPDRGKVVVLAPTIAYADLGPASVSITFDACASRVILARNHLRNGLFLGRLRQADAQPADSPMFSGAAAGDDGKSLCLRANPANLITPRNVDACSVDAGFTWFTLEDQPVVRPPTAVDAAGVDRTFPGYVLVSP